MRYVRIFSIYFQDVLTDRSRSLVWFLMSLAMPLIMILFWKGAVGNGSIAGWTFATITSYYLILTLEGSMLMAHMEEDVAKRDIQRGELVQYLLKPFPYYFLRFFGETPYRILQGSFAIVAFIIVAYFFPHIVVISNSFPVIVLGIIIAILAYLISYTVKLTLGILAFWVVDMRSILELFEFSLLIFSGAIIPIAFAPEILQKISYALPFSYMVYFPAVAFLGKLTLIEMVQVIGGQLCVLGIFICIYLWLWKQGLKKFTAVGQ